MSPPERLESLLARYVERQVAGAEAPDPAELCRDTPELLAPLRELIVKLESVGQRLADSTLEGESIVAWLEARRAAPGGGEAATENAPAPVALEAGRVLSNRYRVRSLLGRGGQGEVWRAEDLKLRVDVALKGLRLDRSDALRLAQVRREVRAARSVSSPNVCRIFDLVDVEGEELVSMEYVDGATLYDVLRERGPLALEEALEIASQLLSGLEAIHAAGLVHRDVKPENVMLTRTGRVVVMDLGLAKVSTGAGEGSISGTPAYMAPEQAVGDAVDARADVFSAGVLLAEMMHPGGIGSRESRRSVWEGVRRDPVELAETPWKPVLERALARAREERLASVRELARALERVTLTGSVQDASPYPGLARFEEADARYFFGREAETETLWKRLVGPSRLLAVAGPSGAGKSSFLRAGLLAAKPEGWATIVVTPGGAPFVALGQAIGEALAGDADSAGKLVRFPEPDIAVELVGRWRARHREALLVVDQFEELFTQNPDETQRRFAELVGRLPLEADVHVVLGLRDDFLLACQLHEPLAPIFSDLTPLQAPVGAALRRALTQPALQCGFRFEDDALVDEMLAVVEGERGALPLLAFAAASLWERRDRTEGLLTRASYRAIGGVAGALAGHAEATLERIGAERRPLVRDLFRNLVTPQGTRTSRTVEELTSIAEERDVARAIVATLVDARLLTEYETPGRGDGVEPEPRVEIVHESLLAAWPRLVRWRTQDADAAQMREQVRQAAQVWDEKGRPEELLWTGASYREYALWRERYPGRLTDLEQDFGRAMTLLAGRRRRRRRALAAAAFAAISIVAITVVILWTRAERAREETHQEALRAEAGKLLALGRLEQESDPSAALAFAMASLELADEPQARRFALETLYRGPAGLALPGEDKPSPLAFSRDGEWLAAGTVDGELELWSRAGGPPRRFPDGAGRIVAVAFDESGLRLLSATGSGRVTVRSVPDGAVQQTLETGAVSQAWFTGAEGDVILLVLRDRSRPQLSLEASRWSPGESQAKPLARFDSSMWPALDPTGSVVAVADGPRLYLLRIAAPDAHRRMVGEHRGRLQRAMFSPDGTRLAASDSSGEIRVWNLGRAEAGPEQVIPEPLVVNGLQFDKEGRRLAVATPDGISRIWSLNAPADAAPIQLRRGTAVQANDVAFHPAGDWIATSDYKGVSLWTLRAPMPVVIGEKGAPKVLSVAVAPDGSWFAASIGRGEVRIVPLTPETTMVARLLPTRMIKLVTDPKGETILGGSDLGEIFLLPVRGVEPVLFQKIGSQAWSVAFSRDGRLIAVGGGQGDPREGVVRVWDLRSGLYRTLDPGSGCWVGELAFLPDGRLLSTDCRAVRLWDLQKGSGEVLRSGECSYWLLAVSPDGARVIEAGASFERSASDEVHLTDLATRDRRVLPQFGRTSSALAFDRNGEVVLEGDLNGPIRVGRISGGEPHLLLGHERLIFQLATTPDGRTIVSAGDDGTIRLWPMPDLSRPPLHTLPHDELLAKLATFTNLRVVVDPASPTGYATRAETFAGWSEAPSW